MAKQWDILGPEGEAFDLEEIQGGMLPEMYEPERVSSAEAQRSAVNHLEGSRYGGVGSPAFAVEDDLFSDIEDADAEVLNEVQERAEQDAKARRANYFSKFTRVYESRDGGMHLYIDADGHIQAVKASRLI